MRESSNGSNKDLVRRASCNDCRNIEQRVVYDHASDLACPFPSTMFGTAVLWVEGGQGARGRELNGRRARPGHASYAPSEQSLVLCTPQANNPWCYAPPKRTIPGAMHPPSEQSLVLCTPQANNPWCYAPPKRSSQVTEAGAAPHRWTRWWLWLALRWLLIHGDRRPNLSPPTHCGHTEGACGMEGVLASSF